MKAIYFQPTPVQLDVIGKPNDGCADLGRGKDILVKGVPIDDSKSMGTCKLIDEDDPKASKSAAGATKAAEEAAKAKAAEEAAKAKAAAEATKAAEEAAKTVAPN